MKSKGTATSQPNRVKAPASIRNFIILNNLLLVFVPMMVFAGLFTQLFTTSLKSEIDRKNYIILNSVADRISSYLDSAVRFIRQASNLENPELLASKDSRSALVERLLDLYPIVESLEVLDRQGQVLEYYPSNPDAVGTSRAGQEYFRRILGGEADWWSPSFISPTTLKATTTLAVRAGDKVLAAYLNLEKITNLATEIGRGLDPTLAISVTDNAGVYISHRNSIMVKTRVTSPFFPPLREGLLAGQHYFSIKYNEEAYLVEARQLTRPDWVIMVTQKDTDAYSAIDNSRTFFLIFALVWLLAAIGYSLFRIRNLVRPLHLLADQIRQVSEGDYTGTVGPQPFRELEILARQFNDMVTNIHNSHTLLTAQNGELERFTYTVSHDLKSPLITIKGFLGFVRQDVAAGNLERLNKDLDRIEAAGQKMEILLGDLLELSRLGRIVNAPTEFPMLQLVQTVIELLDGPIRLNNAEVVLASKWPRVRGDELRLREVWQNLLENALKYRDPSRKPHLELGWEQSAKGPIFFVRDNGRGIAPEYYDKVFGLFEKLDQASDGTGIGLALVKRIIDLHGGRIWIEPSPGQGATFKFILGKDFQV